MPLGDEEYRDILQTLRQAVRKVGLGSVDERILPELRGSEGSFYDLTSYLKLLIAEISLGSDVQLGRVLRRVRQAAETESGRPIEGFRVQLTSEQARLYNTESFDFAPAPVIQEVVSELHAVLEELNSDWENRPRKG